MKMRYFYFALLIMVLGLGAFFVLRASPATAPVMAAADAPTGGKPAFNWKLQALVGKTVQLSDFKGKLVVMNFWATWCPPCGEEIPDFIALQNEYHGKDVVIIGLSVDSVQPSEVAAFAKQHGMNYPIVMATLDAATKYGADVGVPITCIIDPKGNLVAQHLGIVTKADVETEIEKFQGQGH